MWKHRQTPRRPIGVESLEGRQLLNGAGTAASTGEITIIPSVAVFETFNSGDSSLASGLVGHLAVPVESGSWGPRATTVPLEIADWSAGGDRAAAPLDPWATGEILEAGRFVASFSAEAATAPQWGPMAREAPSGGASIQSETFIVPFGGMATTAATWGGAPTAAAVPASPMPGAPGTQPSGNGAFDPSAGFDPGDSLAFARAEANAPTMAVVIAPPGFYATGFTLTRERFDPSEAGALATPSNPMAAINAPSANGAGIQALYGPGGGTGGPTTAPAASAVPAGSGIQAQAQAVPLADPGSGGEHPIAGIVSLQRAGGTGPVESGRLAPTTGRSMLAAMSADSLHVAAEGSQDASPNVRESLIPGPQAADLIAELLPFTGNSLERSLDDFVRQLEQVDVAALVAGGPTPVLFASLAILSTAASAVVVRGIVRRRAERERGVRMVDSLGRELALSFPELPRSWSEKRR